MRIYVGRMPYDWTVDDLVREFSEFGEVNAAETSVVIDKVQSSPQYGKSRGFGFVDMPNDAEAQAAIDAMNGKTVGDRRPMQLVVNEARPREERPAFGGNRDNGQFQPRQPQSDEFVTPSVDEQGSQPE